MLDIVELFIGDHSRSEVSNSVNDRETPKYISFKGDLLDCEDLEVLGEAFIGSTFHTSVHNGVKQIESDWEILYFERNRYNGQIECRVKNLTWEAKGRNLTGSMPWSEVKALLPVETKQSYVVHAWDISKLCLVPHEEIGNSFWFHYEGHRLGRVSLEAIGEADEHGYCIRYQWVAQALNTDIQVFSTEADRACIDLMLHGVL